VSFPSDQRSHVNKGYQVESDLSIACSPFMEGDDMRQILDCVYVFMDINEGRIYHVT
jgi:hypothetical protein